MAEFPKTSIDARGSDCKDDVPGACDLFTEESTSTTSHEFVVQQGKAGRLIRAFGLQRGERLILQQIRADGGAFEDVYMAKCCRIELSQTLNILPILLPGRYRLRLEPAGALGRVTAFCEKIDCCCLDKTDWLKAACPDLGNGGSETCMNPTASLLGPFLDNCREGDNFTFTHAAFTDPQGDAITLTASGLPANVNFVDNGDGSYTITGVCGDAGLNNYIVIATDAQGNISLLRGNALTETPNAPVTNTGNGPDNQTVLVGTNIAPMLFSQCFSNPDGGGLTYSVVGTLPPGLALDAATGVVQGTATTVTAGAVITIQATNNRGESETCQAVLTVTSPNANQPPVANGVAPAPQTVNVGSAITPMSFSACFSDPEGDPITLSIDPATPLPAGLSFDAGTGIVSGAPTTAGNYPIVVLGTDPNGGQAQCISAVTAVAVGNQPPVNTGNAPAPQTVNAGTAIAPMAFAACFNDPEGDQLTYSVSPGTPLPTGVTIDAATGVVSGTTTVVGVHAITVIATDVAGNTQTCDSVLTVQAVGNQQPVNTGNAPAPQVLQVNTPMTPMLFAPCFNDPDGDQLTYSVAPGNPLPAGVVLDTVQGIVSGTPTVVGNQNIVIQATDPSGASVTCSSSITVTAAPNQAPVNNGNAPADQTIGVNNPIIPMDFGACFTDPDGDPLTFTTLNPLPTGLTINAAGVVLGVPTVPQAATNITVIATDPSGATAQCTASLTVNAAPNQAPFNNGNAPADQAVTVDTPIAPMNFGACFTEPDGDALTYTMTPAIPGVSIDANTGVVSGTPNTVAVTTITVTATDPGGLSDTCSAVLTVNPVGNQAPVNNGNAPADQTVTVNTAMVAMDFGACFTDPDGDALTFTMAPAIAGVSINAATGVVTGTPTAIANTTITVTATDPGGLSATCSAALNVVAAPNQAPVNNGNAPAPQTIQVNTAMAAMDFGACFTDPDGDPLTFTMTPTIAGVSINANTGVVTGTPTVVANNAITVTATDPSGASATCTSSLNVTAVPNQAPFNNGNLPAFQTITQGDPIAPMDFGACFTDPDGDPLTYALTPAVAGLSIDAAGVVTGTPTDAGNVNIIVTATDPGGLSATCARSIQVNLPNVSLNPASGCNFYSANAVPAGGYTAVEFRFNQTSGAGTFLSGTVSLTPIAPTFGGTYDATWTTPANAANYEVQITKQDVTVAECCVPFALDAITTGWIPVTTGYINGAVAVNDSHFINAGNQLAYVVYKIEFRDPNTGASTGTSYVCYEADRT